MSTHDANNIIEAISATLFHQIHNVIRGSAMADQVKFNDEHSGPVRYNNLLLTYIDQLKDKRIFDKQLKCIYQTYNDNYPAISGINNFIQKFLSSYVSSSLLHKMHKNDKYTCFQNSIRDSLMTYVKYLANSDSKLYFHADENEIIGHLKPHLIKIISETTIEISYKILNPESGVVSKIQYNQLCKRYKELEDEYNKYKKKTKKKINRLQRFCEEEIMTNSSVSSKSDNISTISQISNLSDLHSSRSHSSRSQSSRSRSAQSKSQE